MERNEVLLRLNKKLLKMTDGKINTYIRLGRRMSTCRQRRLTSMDCAIKRIQNTFGEKFSVVRMMEARKNVERMTEKNKCFHEKDKFQKYAK